MLQHKARILYLKDLIQIRYAEQEPDAYYRLNGLNMLTIQLESEQLTNQLWVAQSAKKTIETLRSELPPGYSLVQTYDATEFLREELNKIAYRSLFTLGILLVFVLVVSRSFRYLLLILTSLLANLAIACMAFYLLELEMHLYSLAGITVSLGLLIDNSIVMIDHVRHQGNKRVFLAILAATLTTLAALSAIFFLPEVQQVNLIDFAWVMLVNLGVSLGIALWLIPALLGQFPLATGRKSYSLRKARRIVQWQRPYRGWIRHSLRWRPLWITLAILGFGLPVFMLPEDWKEDSYRYYGPKQEEAEVPWYERWYEQTLGSSNYQREIKPWVDPILGGSLRLFMEETFPNSRYRPLERTVLYVRGKMPYGTTVKQMNEAFQSLENFLSQFEEIEQYETQISSSQQALSQIHFHPEYERKGFPYFLKSLVESHVIDLGAVDWQVYGVGRGFNNAIGMGSKNSRIQMRGFNYEQLFQYAEGLKKRLLEHPRIKEVFLNGEIRWDYRPHSEFVMNLDKQLMTTKEIQSQQVLDALQPLTLERRRIHEVYQGGKYSSVILLPKDPQSRDIWQIRNQPLVLDSIGVNLQQLARLEKIPAGDVIYKEDQQYHIWVEYDFIGPEPQSRTVQEEMVREIQQLLPIGYTASAGRRGGWWSRENKTAYGLIFLVVAMIFGICAILLESLRQPLAVIAMIPLSFIGVFLTFYLFEFNFDQGGYAAFLLLCGISVNSALYIINDFNNFRKLRPFKSQMALYLKAFRHKIFPISLTILSTLLGLLPFVWAGPEETFWFALAVGTIGGLIFSLLAVGLYLPMLVLKKGRSFY